MSPSHPPARAVAAEPKSRKWIWLGAVGAVLAALAFLYPKLRPEPRAEGLAGEIDRIARDALERGPVAGISIAVARGGRIVHAAGYGFSDLENRLPATPETVYRVGSISKQFTAAAVMRLAEEGRIHLDDPLTNYLPDYAAAEDVTIESLLNHTSGIRNYTTMQSWWEKMTTELTPELLVAVFRDEPFDFPPGTSFSYSNSGYAVLGLIVERVSGAPFGGYLQEHVISPLGLGSTSYCDDEALIPDRSRGYKVVGGRFLNADYVSMSQAYAAGAVCSSATDLVRWFHALSTGDVLSSESYERMTRPGALRDGTRIEYGYGLAVSYLDGRRRINHVGGTLGYSSQIAHYPDDDVTIVVLTNTESSNAASLESAIARAVLDLGEATSKDILLEPSELARYAGKYDIGLTTVKVSAKEGRLHIGVQVPGLAREYRLLYQGEGVFRAEADDEVSVQFRGTHASVDSFVLVRHGITMWGRRVGGA
jgi:CubicO group peptidase (beta-lactamase class C family)